MASSAAPPRPPKPVPFGAAIAEEKKSLDEDETNALNVSLMDSSERSRQSLRRDLRLRRTSLTPQEHGFLEELCVHGNEIEVQLALEKLNDSDLFFLSDEGDDDESEQAWPMETIAMGREVSTSSVLSESLQSSQSGPSSSAAVAASRRSSSASVSSSIGGEPLGSERRQALLQTRRKSQLHMFGNLWKAHDSGLAISTTASRRSVLSRRRSLSSSIGSRRDVFQRQQQQMRNDDIFRGPRMNDTKSDNVSGRRSSWMNPRRTSDSSSGRSSSFKMPPKPVLRRMMSEGSRNKSVTFSKELPPTTPRRSGRATSEGQVSPAALPESPPKMAHVQTGRSSSTGSFPSLHHAHSVHSIKSSPTSAGGVPPLQHAHSVHSVKSNSSGFPSLHHGHRVRSDSAVSSFTGLESLTTAPDEGRDTSDAGMHDEISANGSSPHPIPTKVEIPSGTVADIQPATKVLQHDESSDGHKMARPVLMRDASVNAYQGEGIEVAEWDSSAGSYQKDTLKSLASFGDHSLRSSNSFDESMSYERMTSIFRRSIPRCMSDEEMAGVFLGPSRMILRDRESMSTKDLKPADDDASWQIGGDDDEDYYDAWKVIEDEYENGYGGNDTLPFRILGTSVDDVGAHPHVMSPPLLESLQHFIPNQGENYWMKYSMVRDGASLHTFLQYARGSKHTFLAIETVEGEVFGAFTNEPWRKNWNFFGSGESFLWRMRHSRKEKTHSIIDQAHMESEIDVFPYTGENNCIQLCTHDKIAVGGGAGAPSFDEDAQNASLVKDHDWGFGLAIQGDMLSGTSSPCATFSSPGLSLDHPNGELFEIINMELWTMTPCLHLEDAEKLELGKLFLEQNRR